MITISNQWLTVGISSHGAELQSIVRNSDGRQFLWQGDPAYWKRRSPVLFPIVGSLWEGRCLIDGHTYQMSQHGFARDMDFTLVGSDATSALFRLESCDESRSRFPFDFTLEIGYRLTGKTVQVLWTVINREAARQMPFQIGAHPAFNYVDYATEMPVQGYFAMAPARDSYQLSLIGQKGCLKSEKGTFATDGGVFPINRQTFNGDALVFEHSQVQRVDLCDRNQRPYLRVAFDAPVVGLWSPARDSYAPFVCIEPWYGRCDREHYSAEFAQKDWTQHLAPGQQFNASYTIEIL